jgi:hypothetical protein
VQDPRLLFGTLATLSIGGGEPRDVLDDVDYADWDPAGKALAVVHFVRGENRLEYPIGKVLVHDRGWMSEARVAPAGDRVSFTDTEESLHVADLSSGAERDLGRDAPSSAWSPLTGEIWYGRVDRGTTEIRATTPGGRDRLVASLAGDFALFDVSTTGKVLLGRVVESAEILRSSPGEARDQNLSNFDRSVLIDSSPSGDEIVFIEMGMAGGLKGPVMFLRRTDGTAPKRLGDYAGGGLSTDGRFVLAGSDDGLVLVPTGAGEPVHVAVPGLILGASGFFPDGKSIFFVGEEPDRPKRVWAMELATGKRRPITPEGVRRPRLSLDGRTLFAVDETGTWNLYPVDSGPPTPIAGLSHGEEPTQWAPDGTLFVRGTDEARGGDAPFVARVFRVDPRTGRRVLLKEFPPLSPTTGGGIGTIVFSANGKICLYNHHRYSSDLFLAEGLR